MLLDLLQALLLLVAIAFVGRVVLALLPVGALGAHGARELPATWAASHLLGLLVLSVHVRAAWKLEPGPAWSSGWALVVPWLLVAAVRFAFLPGALVPRHEPRGERVPALALALGALSAAMVSTPWWIEQAVRREAAEVSICALRFTITEELAHSLAGMDSESGARIVGAASAIAALVFVAHALAVARRAPLARALAVAWLAWLVFLVRGLVWCDDHALLVLAFGAGAAASVEWIRRGDRRALALSALAFGAATVFTRSSWPASLACLLALGLASPRASRAAGATWCGISALFVMAHAARTAPAPTVAHGEALLLFLVPAFAFAASAYALRVLVLRRPDARERIDSTVKEARAVGGMLLLGTFAALGGTTDSWHFFAEGMPHLPAALLPFLGLVPLLVGLVGAPDECTLPPA